MKQIPRVKFAHLPTPIEPLDRLSKLLNGPQLIVKRDDQTGLALGGNKARKLEFLVAEALNKGAKTLITAGAVQSNHCRQTAAVAARFGFDCVLVLAGEKPKSVMGNLMLDNLLGSRIVWTNHSDLDKDLNRIFSEEQEANHRPYLIPFGGSNPVGVAGYVQAMSELNEQSVQADWIIIPSGSGGTQAGMVIGAKLFGFKGKILGISIIEPEQPFRIKVRTLAQASADYLGIKTQVNLEDIVINATYLGDGYGVMGKPEQEAIQLFARNEGLILDPVYTGRAAAGMIDLIRSGFFSKNDRILFWHTGGSPTLFVKSYSDKLI